METGKRRRRIERLKVLIRGMLFLREHVKHIVIASLICLTMTVFPAVYFSLRPKAAEENSAGNTMQTALAAEAGRIETPDSILKKTERPDGEDPDEKDVKSIPIMDVPEKEPGEIEKDATSHKTEQPVGLSDVFAEKDSIAIFKCFYPEASAYTWETFSESIQEWVKAPATDITEQTDELLREVSSFIAIASEENDNLMVRCTVDFPDKETCTDTAVLHVLDKSIAGISADDFTTESGKYISIRDIPVKVTYQDGSEETIVGLNGAYFFESEMTSEESISVSGNMIETQTTVIESHEYVWIDAGEKEAFIRYKNAENPIDVSVNLVGEDKTAPAISKFVVDDFEISNVDKPVTVTVTIEAADDTTPEKDLLYALLPEGKEPEEADWKNSPSFEAEITQNGIWAAYCKDKGGNIAMEEKEIIAVDNKAPYVLLQLKNDPKNWCQSNTIIVKATDALPIEYRYICAETGDDSGWVTRSRYDIGENGIWTVQVKDAAGNISEEEITVSNIDKQPPVIQEIKEVKVKEEKEGETSSNEN